MTLLAFATMFGHGPLLTAHALVGSLVLLLSVAAIFASPARKFTLYALGVQIVLGFIVAGVLKIAPSPLHAALAILVGGVYAAANAFERKGRPQALVRAICALGVVMIGATYYIGEHALR